MRNNNNLLVQRNIDLVQLLLLYARRGTGKERERKGRETDWERARKEGKRDELGKSEKGREKRRTGKEREKKGRQTYTIKNIETILACQIVL